MDLTISAQERVKFNCGQEYAQLSNIQYWYSESPLPSSRELQLSLRNTHVQVNICNCPDI